MTAKIIDIHDGAEICTGASPEDSEAERQRLLEGVELLRQAVEHNHVKCLVWAWLGTDELVVNYRLSNIHSAGNTNLRGLAAGLSEYVSRKCRGEL
jgi:hypothetical protein